MARVFQHELDHLDGVLLLQRLDPEQRKQAMKTLRSRVLDQGGAADGDEPGRQRNSKSEPEL